MTLRELKNQLIKLEKEGVSPDTEVMVTNTSSGELYRIEGGVLQTGGGNEYPVVALGPYICFYLDS
jgi:hypothetical protein